jgi:hypothetical protein
MPPWKDAKTTVKCVHIVNCDPHGAHTLVAVLVPRDCRILQIVATGLGNRRILSLATESPAPFPVHLRTEEAWIWTEMTRNMCDERRVEG